MKVDHTSKIRIYISWSQNTSWLQVNCLFTDLCKVSIFIRQWKNHVTLHWNPSVNVYNLTCTKIFVLKEGVLSQLFVYWRHHLCRSIFGILFLWRPTWTFDLGLKPKVQIWVEPLLETTTKKKLNNNNKFRFKIRVGFSLGFSFYKIPK